MRKYLRVGTIATAALGAACCSQSWASTIVAPITAEATSQFVSPSGNNYSISNTINQSGLSLPYISGLTDFDSYLTSKPEHTSDANGTEWFSQDFSKGSQSPASQNPVKKQHGGKATGNGKKNKASRNVQQVGDFGTAKGKGSFGKEFKKKGFSKSNTFDASSSASAIAKSPLVSIIYGFDELTSINGFVLWNEEYAGIGTTELLWSIDGENYTLLSTIKPEPSQFAEPGGDIVPYLAQVFSFDPTLMLFFKLLIYDCPKPAANRESFSGCGIGEVAFSALPRGPNQAPAIPIPAALPLFGAALGILAWFGRRQRNRI